MKIIVFSSYNLRGYSLKPIMDFTFDKLKMLQDATSWISSKALCRGTNRQHFSARFFQSKYIYIVSNDK